MLIRKMCIRDSSPVDKRFKKEKVKGVSAKVITVSMLGGDCYPATPIGINLPNADWIRRDHGSKSVTIENITEAYDKASQGNGFSEEFVWSDVERNGMRPVSYTTLDVYKRQALSLFLEATLADQEHRGLANSSGGCRD